MHKYPAALATAMKVLVEAYGCTLNRGEAEEFSDGLLAMGYSIAESQAEADAFALFTCGVIEITERHMLKRISELASQPGKKLIVCGCLPNISPKKIRSIAPSAHIVGTGDHMAALEYFTPGVDVSQVQRASSVGILPIATGCMGHCTYCVTKEARGSLQSRKPDRIAERMRQLLRAGAAEIQLCAQDTAVYGNDIGTDLGHLIELLGAETGKSMIRIGMMNPASVRTDIETVLKAYAHPGVFKFLHLPVQSGSDPVLGRMGRRHTVSDFEAIVERFRSEIPDLSLSTDIILGFPGETDDDFNLSLELMERVKPDIINITRFSSRPGTEAHDMKPKVPSRIAKDRSRILTEQRFRLTEGNYARFEGRILKALATERRMPGSTFFRTPEYKPIVVSGEHELGKWHSVMVNGREKTHLCGSLIKT